MRKIILPWIEEPRLTFGYSSNQILQHTGRRYLTGYHSDEEEFKALMDAGITFAKEYHLTPGISLTKEQMAALTSDIVWLDTMTVMVNGRPMDVIYPRVYMRANSPMRLQDDGALISASQLVVNTKDTVENTGTLLGDSIVISADTLQQGGHIRAKTLGVTTIGDIVTTGTIDATDTVQLLAGRDIRMNNTITHLQNQDILTSMAGIAVSGDEGVLLLSANRDVKLAGATLTAMGDKSNIAIGAGRNVDLSTDTLMAKQDMTQDSTNYLRTYRKTELGTAIAGHDITILAKKDVTGRAATIEGTGDVRLGAGQSLTLTNGETISKDSFGAKYKVSGLLSSTTTTMKRDSEHRSVDGSLVTGSTVTMESGKDMHLTAATVVGDTAVTLRAGGNLTATSAEQYDHEASMISVKKSGLMGSGLGIMIGTQQTKDTAMGEGITQVGTVIGSGQGLATVEAGTHIHLTSSDVIGAKGIHIEGNSVTLDGKNNITRERYEHEASSSGLSISLGGSVASAATTAVNYLQQANHRSDKRLAALETLEAGKSLKEGLNAVNAFSNFSVSDVQNAYDTAAASAARDAELARATKQPKDVIAAKELQVDELNRIAKDPKAVQERYNQEKAAKRDSLVNIHVGIGSSHSKSVIEVNETTYAGGSIQSADGTVRIIARGDSNTTFNANTIVNGNITAIGQTIQGKVVDLQAKGDVNLLAGTNTTHVTEDSKSSGWSVGASIGTTGFLGGDIGINKAKSEGLTDRTTHTGTTVVGTDAVQISSGKDTNMIGSQVQGNKITAKIGGDLQITSVQDTDNYKANSKNSSLSVGFSGVGITSFTPYAGKGKTNSTYESVTNQAGIYAGTDGYDITVKDNTTLTGSVIDSKAAPDKNSLTTGSLTMKDIENKASYEDSYRGIGYTYDRGFNVAEENAKRLGYATAEEKESLDSNYNKVGLVPDLGMSSKESASSMTKSAIAPGKLTVTKEPVNLNTVNRDTKNSLNELGKIFDKKKLEERQELAKLFAKNADEAIHQISESKGWKDGSKEKIALHTLVGGITAELGGHAFIDGGLAGGVNEAAVAKLMNAIGRDNPDMVQIASAVLGYATNKLAGKDGEAGSAVAQWGTKWNYEGKTEYLGVALDQNVTAVTDQLSGAPESVGDQIVSNVKSGDDPVQAINRAAEEYYWADAYTPVSDVSWEESSAGDRASQIQPIYDSSAEIARKEAERLALARKDREEAKVGDQAALAGYEVIYDPVTKAHYARIPGGKDWYTYADVQPNTIDAILKKDANDRFNKVLNLLATDARDKVGEGTISAAEKFANSALSENSKKIIRGAVAAGKKSFAVVTTSTDLYVNHMNFEGINKYSLQADLKDFSGKAVDMYYAQAIGANSAATSTIVGSYLLLNQAPNILAAEIGGTVLGTIAVSTLTYPVKVEQEVQKDNLLRDQRMEEVKKLEQYIQDYKKKKR